MNVPSIIQADWASKPGVMRACLSVWKSLSAREFQLDHYTFADLQESADESDVGFVSEALLYLSNPRLKVLNICLMYELHGRYLELPDDEVTHYLKGEGVIHPEFGELIPESEIMVCFTPGAVLQRKDAP